MERRSCCYRRVAFVATFVLLLAGCIALVSLSPDGVGANGYSTSYCCPCGWYDNYGVYHPGEIECSLLEYYPDQYSCAPCESDSTSEKDSGTVVAHEVVRASSKEVGRLISTRIAAIVSSKPMAARRNTPSVAPDATVSRTSLFGPSDGSKALFASKERVQINFMDALAQVTSGDMTLEDFSLSKDSLTLDRITPLTGLSSGDSPSQPTSGFWASGSWSDLRNKLSSTEFDGDLYLLMTGFDHMFREDLMLGGALGYERTDLDTAFNQGSLEADGFTVSPYGAWILGNGFSVDLLASYTWVDYDSSRNQGNVTGSYDADRIMVSGSLNYYYFIDDWNLNARLAYLYSSEDADGFEESNGTRVGYRDTDLGEIRIGGRVGRFFGDWDPYLSLFYLYDTTMEKVVVGANQEQASNDRDELEATLGVNYASTEHTLFSLDLTHAFFREDYRSTSVSLNFRFEF